MSSDAWWNNLIGNLIHVCRTLEVDAVCSPAVVPSASLTKMLCDRLAVQFRGAQCVRPLARYAQQVY
jgi:hypothetical protein